MIVNTILTMSVVAGAGLAVPSAVDAAVEELGDGPEHLTVNFYTYCKGDKPVLQVHNVGAPWPDFGELQLVSVEHGEVIASRRLRLTHNQRASFDLRSFSGVPSEVAIRVEPVWYERSAGFDATIRCG